MSITYNQWAQSRDNNVTANTLFTLGADEQLIGVLKIVNNTNAGATCTVYWDNDGSTYDESTMYEAPFDIPPYGSVTITPICMSTQDGTIGYKSSVANAITATLSGAKLT